ncbi:MAG TPA: c-type cytochrome [Guyparkeria sp.]|nr:c-type cytochrome [Guyparkeria sp.]
MSQIKKKTPGGRPIGKVLVATGLALCLMSGTAQAAGASGSSIGYTCMGCHGADGKGSGDIPRLAGQPAEAIVGMMMGAKSDAQEWTVMNRLAKGYTDDEIRAVAEFFANL